MDRSAIQTFIYWLMRQVSTNSDVDPADMLLRINEAYTQVMNDVMPEVMSTFQTVYFPRTTYTSGSGTSVVVSSVASMSANTWMCIYEGSRFEVVRVTNVDAPTKTLTLASPGLVYTSFTAAAVVVPISAIITTTKRIKAAIYLVSDQSVNDVYLLDMIRDSDFYRLGMSPSSVTYPNKFALLLPTEVWLHPVPTIAGYLRIFHDANTSYSLAETTSVPVLDAQYHILIVLWALALCLIRSGWTQNAATIFQIYETLKARAKTEIYAKLNPAQPLEPERQEL